MPSPRKRALRAAVGNILVPVDATAPTATQIAYSDTWWNTVLTEHGNNYASNDKPFANGEVLLIAGSDDEYDGLISGGEPGATAYATITAAVGNTAGADQFAEQEYFKITDAAGTTIHYVLTNTNGSGVATGTLMDADSDTGADNTLGAAIADLGKCVAVRVTINGGSESNQGQLLNTLIDAIDSAQGHNAGSANSVIKLTPDLTPAASTQTMKLEMVAASTTGNVTITKSGLTEFTVDRFGTDSEHRVAVPHYWCDTVNGSTVIATAADTKKITTATGVLYDPSGPHSSYIPLMETVSAGNAHYVVIMPDGWNSGDYITWELVGDTEGTNDKLSMMQINGSDSAALLSGVKSDGTREDVDARHGTVGYTGTTYHHANNAKGIAVVWEADGTGTNAAAIKKGWYFRWKHTAV